MGYQPSPSPPPKPVALIRAKTDACELCNRIERLYQVYDLVLVCATCAQDLGYIPQPVDSEGRPKPVMPIPPPNRIVRG